MVSDKDLAAAAIEAAAQVEGLTNPNPWVGAALRTTGGQLLAAASSAHAGSHAEANVLRQAQGQAGGAVLFSTLEPCAHVGRNPACVETIVSSGVSRVIVGVEDPDARVSGRGIAALRAGGITVEMASADISARIEQQLKPYLTQRRTGRPYVVLKMAMTMDGRIAAPDGSSQWITGAPARRDVHQLRAKSDVMVVGAGTVRADDPSLTVRLDDEANPRQPLRVVLGTIPETAKVRPAREWHETPEALLDQLGSEGHLQVMVEGGGTVAGDFHRRGLVDRYVFYLAPAFLGGDDGIPVLGGQGRESLHDAWRGRFVGLTQLCNDVRIDLEKADG